MNILWLRPNKPEDISVGRHQIAKILKERGYAVEVWNATSSDFFHILRSSPDVVVGTTRLGAFIGTWKKLVSGTPLVVDHIDPIDQLSRSKGAIMTSVVDRLERFSFCIADEVVVTYEEELDRVGHYNQHVVKTTLGVDYIGFNDPSTETLESANDVLRPAVNEDSKILIYIGGLEPTYHIREVVESLDYLDGWELVILGDGSERGYVSSVADGSDSIHYFGTVPYQDVPGYLHLSDVGISLLDDPHTLKVLEYGAAELPVVYLRGAAESAFGDAVTYTSTDPADVATNVRVAIDSSTVDLAETAKNHSWQSVADDYEGAITRAAGIGAPDDG